MATDETSYMIILPKTSTDKSPPLFPVDEYQADTDFHKTIKLSLENRWFMFQNLVSTPSFEKDSDSNGLADNWTAIGSIAKGLDTDTRYVRHGKKAQRVSPMGQNNGIYQNVSVTAGKYYCLFFWGWDN